MNCDGSPGELGTTNLSSGTGGTQDSHDSTVNDIFGLKSSPSATTAYAWVYTTYAGNIFIQCNPAVGGSAAMKWIAAALSGVPAVGPGVATTIEDIVDTAAKPIPCTTA